MSGRQSVSSPDHNDQEGSKMDGDNVSVLGRILQAAQERREAAGQAYLDAILSSLAVGEPHYRVQQDHLGISRQVIDLINGAAF